MIVAIVATLAIVSGSNFLVLFEAWLQLRHLEMYIGPRTTAAIKINNKAISNTPAAAPVACGPSK